MAGDNLTVSIGADSSKLRADLALAKAQLQGFNKELSDAAKIAARTGDQSQLPQFAANVDAASRQVAALNRQLRATHQEAARGSSAWAAAGARVAGITAEFGRLGGALMNMADNILPHWRSVFALSVAGAAAAMQQLTSASAKSVDELDDTAFSIGMTTEALEAFDLVTVKSGAAIEDGRAGLQKFSRAIGEARAKTADANNMFANQPTIYRGSTDALREYANEWNSVVTIYRGASKAAVDLSNPLKTLGINAALPQFTGPDGVINLMEEFGKRLEMVKDPTIRNALAAGEMGRAYAKFLPIMKNLREEMKTARAEIEAGGGFTSKETIDQSNRYLATMGVLERLFVRLRNTVMLTLADAALPLFKELIAVVERNAAGIRAWSATAAAGVRAVVADLVAFMRGDNVPAQTAWGAAIINTITWLRDTGIPGVTAAFNALWQTANVVAQTINAMFGTNIGPATVLAVAAIGTVTGAFQTLLATASVFLAIFAAGGGWFLMIAAITAATAVALTFSDAIGGWLKLNAPQWVSDLYNWLDKIGKASFTDTIRELNQLAQAIKDAYDWAVRLYNKLPSFRSTGKGGAPDMGAVPLAPFASGGRVPGSGRRDSFPAMLTPGEFVIRRAVVDALGADFFAGLNRGMGSLLPRNHYATGGLVSAMGTTDGATVHLHLDGRSFPMHADNDVAESLMRTARAKQMLSAGRKPSWAGGRRYGG